MAFERSTQQVLKGSSIKAVFLTSHKREDFFPSITFKHSLPWNTRLKSGIYWAGMKKILRGGADFVTWVPESGSVLLGDPRRAPE